MTEKERIGQRIEELKGWKVNLARLKIVKDTSDWMRITRGDIIRIDECKSDYVVSGNMREPRFGIDDQPKYWVFHATELDTGKDKIIKTVFNEEFYVHISYFKIRCYRDPVKESEVLKLVRGDKRFMQGFSFNDEAGNNVRVIDFIKGKSFFQTIPTIDVMHEEYFNNYLPSILWNLKESIEAILLLHQNGFCHGDIRNDHIFIDSESNKFRWIDFDLKQDVQDFDLWSIGNIISYAVAKGIITLKQAIKSKQFTEDTINQLKAEDGSAFYNYRVMNLSKLFPYIPKRLTNILQHFTLHPTSFYNTLNEFYEEYFDMLEADFPQGKDKELLL